MLNFQYHLIMSKITAYVTKETGLHAFYKNRSKITQNVESSGT